MRSTGNNSSSVAQSPTTSTDSGSSSSLGDTLSSCLDLLRIEEPSVRRKAVEFIGSVSPGTVNAYGKWITSLKAIADACAINGQVFSQSEACDFLTVAAKGIESKRAGTKTVNDATFQIYVDIMENYPSLSQEARLHYPRIIVDVVSALDKGLDTNGQPVGVYGVDRYYQTRKLSAQSDNILASYSVRPTRDGDRTSSPPQYSEDLVSNLAQITGRSKKDLEKSLSSLQQADIKKISDLSTNFSRLRKYSKMTDPSLLKKEVEKELGRKLTGNQLQHAINSIRKADIYIENVLDGRFVPHGTHGINHVKHNLEYGYQLMGLIAPRKRRSSQ